MSKLVKKYPKSTKPSIKSSLRGPTYVIEMPLYGRNIDAFGLMLSTENLMKSQTEKQGVRITARDNFVSDDGKTVAFKLDFLVNSSTVGGSKCKGALYIRGVKGDNGIDSFKFVLEKNVDFSDLDRDLMLNAVEHAMKQENANLANQDEPSSPKPRFAARNSAKNNSEASQGEGQGQGSPM